MAAECQTLKVSANKRYLIDERGKPFLWLGDTAWELFHKLDDQEADHYLETRARQGFTVIQAVIISEDSGLSKPDAYGQLPFLNNEITRPNEAFFDHIDHVIKKAASLGLYMAVLPTWADKVPSNRPGKDPVIIDQQKALSYGKYLGKRFAGRPIIWMLGGDRDVASSEAFNIWKAMATGLKGNGSKQLITYHPAGESSSSRWFQNDQWIDLNTYQSGHAHRYMPVYKFAHTDYHQSPTKPFLDAEPAYEDIPLEFWTYMTLDRQPTVPPSILNRDSLLVDLAHFKKGYFDDHDVRVHAYWNLLSGACGHTYGHNSVWQMFKKGGSYVIPCTSDWKEALHSKGAEQIKFLKALFNERFHQLIPDSILVKNNAQHDSTYIAAAINRQRTTAIIYLAIGQDVVTDLSTMKGPLKAWWFDPRTGQRRYIGSYNAVHQRAFTPPTSGSHNDWVLLLEERSRSKK
ncbi:glycoside hydrolase family 140 protein [Mucilaginibacter daejeonensis]|uniref:glycoside hydrolase family 140 protein n=1 Tax=Mucilaginibacter daejeonensis TaxID=398049 RepID=UPI001D176F94|nr:glycoside hydrolase family 140 protein [Mucilaginibacter daejeonensis]UEG54836.1 glycoside hydrolase family 140 protein [Mucilaginibacter daejeonensis]